MAKKSTKTSRWFRVELLFFVVFGALLIAKFLLTTSLGTSTLEFLNSYKYVSSDSYDWIANGLLIFDNDSISFRNPGYVLLIRLLHSLGALFLLPLLGAVAFFVMVLYTYRTCKLVGNRQVALVLTAFLGLNYMFNMASVYILADIYAVALISVSLYYLIKRKYFWSFVLLGLSMLFQNIAFFLMVIWGLFYVANDLPAFRTRLKAKDLAYFAKLGIRLMVALLPLVIWSTFKLIKFGNPLYTKLDYLELLIPNAHSLRYYLFNTISVFGLIVAPAAVYFVVRARRIHDKTILLLVGGFLFNLLFWVFFYDWDDRRFLIYFAPFVYPLLAYAISGIKLDQRIKLAAMVVLLYPTILPVTSYLVADELPLWHNQYLKVDTGSRTEPFTAQLLSRPQFQPIAMNAYPALYQAIHNQSSNKKPNSTAFTTYSKYVRNNYDPVRKIACVDKRAGFREYLVKSHLLINTNVDISTVHFDDCPAKY